MIYHSKDNEMDKVKSVLSSRKFWALFASLVTVGGAYATGALVATDAVNATVAALAAYAIGTGIEASK